MLYDIFKAFTLSRFACRKGALLCLLQSILYSIIYFAAKVYKERAVKENTASKES
jgi:hypothetical protein